MFLKKVLLLPAKPNITFVIIFNVFEDPSSPRFKFHKLIVIKATPFPRIPKLKSAMVPVM